MKSECCSWTCLGRLRVIFNELTKRLTVCDSLESLKFFIRKNNISDG